jgi:hypothetical protein
MLPEQALAGLLRPARFEAVLTLKLPLLAAGEHFPGFQAALCMTQTV